MSKPNGFTALVAENIQDAAGNPLTGSLVILATDSNNVTIPASANGAVVSAATVPITAGAIPANTWVPDSFASTTKPLNVSYRFTFKDASGRTLITWRGVQPTGDSFDLDTYLPDVAPQAIVQFGPAGPQGPAGTPGRNTALIGLDDGEVYVIVGGQIVLASSAISYKTIVSLGGSYFSVQLVNLVLNLVPVAAPTEPAPPEVNYKTIMSPGGLYFSVQLADHALVLVPQPSATAADTVIFADTATGNFYQLVTDDRGNPSLQQVSDGTGGVASLTIFDAVLNLTDRLSVANAGFSINPQLPAGGDTIVFVDTATGLFYQLVTDDEGDPSLQQVSDGDGAIAALPIFDSGLNTAVRIAITNAGFAINF